MVLRRIFCHLRASTEATCRHVRLLQNLNHRANDELHVARVGGSRHHGVDLLGLVGAHVEELELDVVKRPLVVMATRILREAATQIDVLDLLPEQVVLV